MLNLSLLSIIFNAFVLVTMAGCSHTQSIAVDAHVVHKNDTFSSSPGSDGVLNWTCSGSVGPKKITATVDTLNGFYIVTFSTGKDSTSFYPCVLETLKAFGNSKDSLLILPADSRSYVSDLDRPEDLLVLVKTRNQVFSSLFTQIDSR